MATLSLRLQAILDLLQPCQLLADIGTDHALLPAEAVKQGLAREALGVDMRSAPLEAAERRLRAAGQLDSVELIQSDGLQHLGGREPDVVVIAGMSARAMMRICSTEPAAVFRARQVILQANTELPQLRKWAHEFSRHEQLRLHLVDESITFEAERFFTTLSFAPKPDEDPAYARSLLRADEAYVLGPWLVQRRCPLARRYFEIQRQRLSLLVAHGARHLAADVSIFETGLKP